MVLQQRAQMIGADEPPDLFTTLAGKARVLSIGTLIAIALCCWIAIALWTIPDGMPWPVPAPLLSIGAFGVWGILDRVRQERRVTGTVELFAIDAGEKLAAAVGVLAALAALFALLGVLLGEFIL
jgi:hypothetical protein